jgi:hypothetical protein
MFRVPALAVWVGLRIARPALADRSTVGDFFAARISGNRAGVSRLVE